MIYLKIFEEFEDSEDDLGLIDLYGSECSISISIGTIKSCLDINLIPKMIEDYKEMYVRNGEWGGGPCNKEWLYKYCKEFNTTVSNAIHGWKPTVLLNVKTDNFGTIIVGFSIYDKRAVSFDSSDMIISNEYYAKSRVNLYKFIKEKIYSNHIKFDDVIDMLDLKCDFTFSSIEEDNMK